MIERIYLLSVLIIFLLAFGVKNIRTYLSTRQSIKGKSGKLSLSILLSTLIYLIILLRLLVLSPEQAMELEFIKHPTIKVVGKIFVLTGFLIGMTALITMKNSWRVGIRYDQKTTLITTGIYRLSRNPYFLSYDLLIFGYYLIFPSVLLLVLYLPLVFTFHQMILEEEKYLESVHGRSYEEYKKRTGRYLLI